MGLSVTDATTATANATTSSSNATPASNVATGSISKGNLTCQETLKLFYRSEQDLLYEWFGKRYFHDVTNGLLRTCTNLGLVRLVNSAIPQHGIAQHYRTTAKGRVIYYCIKLQKEKRKQETAQKVKSSKAFKAASDDLKDTALF